MVGISLRARVWQMLILYLAVARPRHVILYDIHNYYTLTFEIAYVTIESSYRYERSVRPFEKFLKIIVDFHPLFAQKDYVI